MKTTRFALALLASLSFTTNIHAEETENSSIEGARYFGLQYANGSYEEEGFPEMEPDIVLARFGSHASENVAVEGRIGFGTSSGSVPVDYMGNLMSLDIEVDNLIGVYVMPGFLLNDSIKLYGALGLTRASLTATATDSTGSGSYSDSETGLSWGVGAEIFFSPTASLSLESMSYLDNTAFQLSSVGAGFNFRY